MTENDLFEYCDKIRIQRNICLALNVIVIIVAGLLIHDVKTQAPVESVEVETTPIPEVIHEEIIEYGYSTVAELDYYHDLAEIEERSMGLLMEIQEPTEEWYETYEEMNEIFEDVGQPDTAEEVLDDSTFMDMCWVVENETRGADFDCKVHVADVILNRVAHPKFANDVHSVVSQPNQFSYWKTNVTESTKQAVEYAMAFPDTTNGALFFQRGAKPPHGLAWIMNDSCGHNFFGYENEVNAAPAEASPTPEAVEEPTQEPTPLMTADNTENYAELLEGAVG